MTAIEKFIRDAEEAWQNKPPFKHEFLRANQYWAVFKDANGSEYTIAIETMLLKPDVWQAVGKVRGWKNEPCKSPSWMHEGNIADYEKCEEYRYHWHLLLDALAEGKTIEEYLQSI